MIGSEGSENDSTLLLVFAMKKVIGIVHNEPASSEEAFSEASMDVLAQVRAFEGALERMGYPWVTIPFNRDIGGFLRTLTMQEVAMVINLCETVDEDARFCGHPAALFELLGIPFSGSPSMSLMLTTDKLVSKRLLSGSLLTPNYILFNGKRPLRASTLKFPVIAKPRFEDASIGIDQDTVFACEEDLLKGVPKLSEQFGDLLVEEYIEGREFNVSLLGYPKATPLPLAEIDFSAFPNDLYRIVGYAAKWERGSFEYDHTPVTFPMNLPPNLMSSINDAAAFCFDFFMLRDYGRVDMRVDARGRVHVIEVNANPCLSPDAGFAKAAERSGLNYSKMIDRLLSFVIQRS